MGVKLLKIQSGVLYPSSSARAVCCREGTAGSDAGEGVMGSVSWEFNREKMKNYCDDSKRGYSEIRQKLKGFGVVNVEILTQWFGEDQWVLQLHPWAPG